MKLSISLATDDVEQLDAFVRTAGLPSRSAGVQQAIRQLRLPDLEDDYAAAWQEWEESGERDAWAVTSDDGIADASR